jgi:hypothetical protein
MYARILTILCCLCLLTACANNISCECNSKLDQIKLGKISGKRLPRKFDYEFLQVLKNNFLQSGATYTLNVRYNFLKVRMQTQQDSSYNRLQAGLELHYELLETNTNKVVSNGLVRTYDSFSLSESPYSDFISEEETFNRLSEFASERLRYRILADLKCWQ